MGAVETHIQKKLLALMSSCGNTPWEQIRRRPQTLNSSHRVQLDPKPMPTTLINILYILNNSRDLRKERCNNTNIKTISTNDGPLYDLEKHLHALQLYPRNPKPCHPNLAWTIRLEKEANELEKKEGHDAP